MFYSLEAKDPHGPDLAQQNKAHLIAWLLLVLVMVALIWLAYF